MDFTKTQKSRYLENETLFLLQIKIFIIAHQGLLYLKNSFAAEVTFNGKVIVFYTVRGILIYHISKNNNFVKFIFEFQFSQMKDQKVLCNS